jgi:imidazolonepropionase-like amidohydrolase
MLGSVVMMLREGMEPSAAVNMVTLNAAAPLAPRYGSWAASK